MGLKTRNIHETSPKVMLELHADTHPRLRRLPGNGAGHTAQVIYLGDGSRYAIKKKGPTLPKTNIAPENGWLEDYFPFGVASWQVLC